MESDRGLTALVSSTLILSAMTKDEVIENFPVGSVVYFKSNEGVLMTVVGHVENAIPDKPPLIKLYWFDDEKHLQQTIVSADSLIMRVKNNPDQE